MLACALLASPAAHGQEPDESPGETPPPPPDPASAEKALAKTWANVPEERIATRIETRSYAGQVIVMDLAALAVLIGAAASESEGTAYLGLATYAFGPPIIHFAHGNAGRGFASLGLRVVAPTLGIGATCFGTGEPVGCLIGIVGGYLTAVVVDAAVLAYEEVEVRDTAKIGPWISVAHKGGVLGIQGLF